MWSGGEAFRQLWSVYGGAHWSPFGGIQEDGLRVRAVLGSADYGVGTAAFADVLLGYHKQLGPVTLKALGGITVTDRRARDPVLALEGTDVGGKGVLEAWWTITDQAWASADLSWGSAQMDYGGRVRLGWRLWPPDWRAARRAPGSAISPASAASCAMSGRPARCRSQAALPPREAEASATARLDRSALSPC
jgi:hypothetical protein